MLEQSTYLWVVSDLVEGVNISDNLETLEGGEVELRADATAVTLGEREERRNLLKMALTEFWGHGVLVDDKVGAGNDITSIEFSIADLQVKRSGGWGSEDCWEDSCQSGEPGEVVDHFGLKM